MMQSKSFLAGPPSQRNATPDACVWRTTLSFLDAFQICFLLNPASFSGWVAWLAPVLQSALPLRSTASGSPGSNSPQTSSYKLTMCFAWI
jgi:hypothetical protein